MTVQLSQEQFQELLGRMSAIHSTTSKNFAQCTLRYHGERDRTKVNQFINGVVAFKQLEQIPDEEALFGLPLLLKDVASTWFAKVRSEVNTWSEALERLKSQFAPTPPPYELYMQIFLKPQNAVEVTDDFVIEKRQLLSLLPPDRHSEEVQLDMIYGLLRLELRAELPRSDIKTFKELSDKARQIETLELSSKTKTIQPTIGKKPKKRCTFCRYKGHTIESCKKKAALLAEAESDNKGSLDTSNEQRKNRMARMIEAQLKRFLPLDIGSPISPTSTVNSADSTVAHIAPSFQISCPVSNIQPVADSPMSPSDDEEPRIYCFGCGAPNVWKSICSNCKNTGQKPQL